MIRTALGFLLISAALFAQAPRAVKPARQEFRIGGVVRDASNGQSLPGVRVVLGSSTTRNGPDRSVLTGPEGTFLFEHLSSDKYQIYAEAVGYPLQGFEQHEAGFLTGVVVGPGISSDHLVFRMQRGGVIAGAVTDEFNDPIRDARVMLFRRGLENGRFDTHFVNESQTNDRGEYKFAGLLQGTYLLAVAARPWFVESMLEASEGTEQFISPESLAKMKDLDVAYPVTFYGGVTEADSASTLELRGGERITADVALHSVAAARVTLKGSVEHPNQPPQLVLSQRIFTDFDVPVQASQIAQRSSTRPNVPIDILMKGLAPGRYFARTLSREGQEDRESEIEINGDVTIDPATISEAGLASVKGLVKVNGATKPPGPIVVVLQGKNGNRSLARPLTENGEFAMEGLQPGTYDVLLGNGQGLHILRIEATNAKATSHTLTLASDAASEVTVELGRGVGEIRGVAQRGDKPVSGAMMLLVPATESDSQFLFRRDQSDSDGTFLLREVVPGKYKVVAIDDGWDLEWAQPAVLKPFLAKAQTIEVVANEKYNLKVEVQTAARAITESGTASKGH